MPCLQDALRRQEYSKQGFMIAPSQALEAAGARRLWNESFFSAPQLKRDSLGRCALPRERQGLRQRSSALSTPSLCRRELPWTLSGLSESPRLRWVAFRLSSSCGPCGTGRTWAAGPPGTGCSALSVCARYYPPDPSWGSVLASFLCCSLCSCSF